MSLVSQVSAGFADIAAEINTLQYPLTSRTLSYSNGGIGAMNYILQSNAQAGTVSQQVTVNTGCSFRIPIRLPATTTQWRLKLRNYDSAASATKTAVTLDKIIIGVAAAPSVGTTAQTGSFTGSTATTVTSTSATIPGDGTFYYSPWVETAGDQFQAGQDHLIGVAFHTSSSLAVQVGIGQCWRWANNTSAVDPTVAGSAAASTASWLPLDWVVEYQVSNRKRAFLIAGDSIPEGTTGVPAGLASPTPLWHGFWDQWAVRRGDMMVQKHCLYGSLTQTWANPSYTGWTRQGTSLGLYDGAVISLGINDACFGTTLANLQSYYTSVITNVRNIVGTSAPIYAVNLMAGNLPVNYSSAGETVRTGFNSWLAQLPYGITAMVDVDSEMRSTSATALDSVLQCGDGIHPSHAGQDKIARVLSSAIR